MKSLKKGALAALVLVVALVVVAQPAFATPRLTTSTGTAAVSPFITPVSADSRSHSTFTAGRTSLSISALGLSVTCLTSSGSGYVPATHTRFAITSLSFGTGVAGDCVTTPAGSVDGNRVHCDVNTRTPWYLHVTSVVGVSSQGAVEIANNARCRFVVTLGALGSSTVTIEPGQSCVRTAANPATTGVTFTSRTRVLTLHAH